jgi:hypothetical protein
MQPPPSRYKVVEQGRRLVVLDTWHGNAPVAGKAAAPMEAERPRTVEQARAALRPARPANRPQPGGMETPALVVTTQGWFDDKAPRRIHIGSETQSKLLIGLIVALPALVIVFMILGWPAMLVAAFLFLQPRVRKGLRRTVTPLLDGMEQA